MRWRTVSTRIRSSGPRNPMRSAPRSDQVISHPFRAGRFSLPLCFYYSASTLSSVVGCLSHLLIYCAFSTCKCDRKRFCEPRMLHSVECPDLYMDLRVHKGGTSKGQSDEVGEIRYVGIVTDRRQLPRGGAELSVTICRRFALGEKSPEPQGNGGTHCPIISPARP